jgi:hypothetical protein
MRTLGPGEELTLPGILKGFRVQMGWFIELGLTPSFPREKVIGTGP